MLQNRRDDDGLRGWFEQHRYLYAPALIDAEVTSAVSGLLLTSKAAIKITATRAEEMLDDFADLPLTRYPMQPHQGRALALRDNFTAYDAFYVALAKSLGQALLTDDRKHTDAPGHTAVIRTWPSSLEKDGSAVDGSLVAVAPAARHASSTGAPTAAEERWLGSRARVGIRLPSA